MEHENVLVKVLEHYFAFVAGTVDANGAETIKLRRRLISVASLIGYLA
jgi:hypothetical protein